jgi:pyruvate kinase
MKNTKVVCTIGPASEEINKLESLINAGMNVMRMNFSHGDHEEQGARIKSVKALNEKNNWNVGIMLDTKGPEIRTGYMREGFADIEAGATVRVTFDYSYQCDAEKIALSYAGLYDDIQIGNKILIEDGNLALEVIAKDETCRELVTRALNSRRLKNKKNVNVPGVILNMK